MVELRDYGDNKTIVVYTDEQKVAQKLRQRKSCLKIIPYEQEQYSKKRVVLVGLDFYFPKSAKKGLMRLATSIS